MWDKFKLNLKRRIQDTPGLIRFMFADGLVKFSFTFLLAILGVSVYLSFFWPEDANELLSVRISDSAKNAIVNMASSYIVTYVFFLLSIILPRMFAMNRWFIIMRFRFHKFYEGWAMIYVMCHVRYRIGNSKVIDDEIVRLRATNYNCENSIMAPRYDFGLNLQRLDNLFNVFSTLITNPGFIAPSSLDVSLQEVVHNPIRYNINMIVELLNKEEVNESIVRENIIDMMMAIDTIFYHLQILSKKLSHKPIIGAIEFQSPYLRKGDPHIEWIK